MLVKNLMTLNHTGAIGHTQTAASYLEDLSSITLTSQSPLEETQPLVLLGTT